MVLDEKNSVDFMIEMVVMDNGCIVIVFYKDNNKVRIIHFKIQIIEILNDLKENYIVFLSIIKW